MNIAELKFLTNKPKKENLISHIFRYICLSFDGGCKNLKNTIAEIGYYIIGLENTFKRRNVVGSMFAHCFGTINFEHRSYNPTYLRIQYISPIECTRRFGCIIFPIDRIRKQRLSGLSLAKINLGELNGGNYLIYPPYIV